MTNNDIINSIRSGNLPIRVSFNNQSTFEKLAGRISKEIEADSVSLLNAMHDNAFLVENKFSEATALGMYFQIATNFSGTLLLKLLEVECLKNIRNFGLIPE